MSLRRVFYIVLLTGSAAIPSFAPSCAHAQAISADEAAALRAEIAQMRAQMNALQARVEKAEAAAAASAGAGTAPASSPPPAPAPALASAAPAKDGGKAANIAWKGAPQISEGGWSFKPKGRLQMDAAYVFSPKGVSDKGLGFSSEMRRLRLGGEGTMPGNFGYKLEFELSDNAVDLVDAYISWRTKNLELRLGNQNQFQSLDELISDTLGSVMERAAFTDAFNFERRLGLAAEWQKGTWLVQGGIFGDSVDALTNSSDGPKGGDENNSYGVDGRLVFAPKLGSTQLHFGASAHWRDLNRLSGEGVRYRQRPFFHPTNTRFLDSGAFPARSETHYGVELAAVRGRWHAAGEAHWLTADRIGGPSPTFFGGYGEVGYYLTPGDTRVYKKGIFDRSPPKNPVNEGGIGSIQLTLRYDYLDMNDAGIRGGTQNGYIAGLVWTPINYLRFNVNYAHLDYTGAAIVANGSRSYGVDALGVRAELDY